MIWFTSDLHLGHVNVLQFQNRPFADIDEMNGALIANINAKVKKNDELWILGDFSFRISLEESIALRKKIYCNNVHLVYGNHDKNYEGTDTFSSNQMYKELKTDYGKIILFHYPIADWNGKHHGNIHLHGHIHSVGEYNQEQLAKLAPDFIYGHAPKHENPTGRIYDVGVDANNYYPVSLDEILEKMQIKKKD